MQKGKTHNQIRCGGCGRYEIWILRGEPMAKAAVDAALGTEPDE
jgi:hypothetical protein